MREDYYESMRYQTIVGTTHEILIVVNYVLCLLSTLLNPSAYKWFSRTRTLYLERSKNPSKLCLHYNYLLCWSPNRKYNAILSFLEEGWETVTSVRSRYSFYLPGTILILFIFSDFYDVPLFA